MKHLVRTDRSIYISIEYLIRRSKKTTASIRSKKYNSQTKTPKQQLKFFTLRHSHFAMFLTGGRGRIGFVILHYIDLSTIPLKTHFLPNLDMKLT